MTDLNSLRYYKNLLEAPDILNTNRQVRTRIPLCLRYSFASRIVKYR
jgi:hypothetical protein